MIPEKKPDPTAGADQVVRPNPVALVGEGPPMLRIPIIEEQLTVSKQLIETGRVRLVKTVREDEQTIHIPLVAELIDVERVAIDRYVDEAPTTRLEGDTTIYSVLKEEYVLQKRLRLVEEIRVTRRQIQTTDTQHIRLRREEMSVERTPVDPIQPLVDSADETRPETNL